MVRRRFETPGRINGRDLQNPTNDGMNVQLYDPIGRVFHVGAYQRLTLAVRGLRALWQSKDARTINVLGGTKSALAADAKSFQGVFQALGYGILANLPLRRRRSRARLDKAPTGRHKRRRQRKRKPTI